MKNTNIVSKHTGTTYIMYTTKTRVHIAIKVYLATVLVYVLSDWITCFRSPLRYIQLSGNSIRESIFYSLI